ncbi:MAG: adenylyl-sulfate kinase [Deltaproteobacteria bacterium]|nr:adenylyl-sulfate kinase [Deltaproteobacteria bacterium]
MDDLRRRPVVVWLTGLPSAGKTTVGSLIVRRLRARDVPVLWLDSDDMRTVMTPTPTFSERERDQFYYALGHVAVRAVEGGASVLVSATASKRVYRENVRVRVPRFVEVWLTCERKTLCARDAKGLYRKAKEGVISTLPGEGVPYEVPRAPELTLDTDACSAEESADRVMRYLESLGVAGDDG